MPAPSTVDGALGVATIDTSLNQYRRRRRHPWHPELNGGGSSNAALLQTGTLACCNSRTWGRASGGTFTLTVGPTAA